MFESFLGINFLNLYDTDAFLAIQIIITLTINCAIFKRMTDIRISWTVFLTLALLDVVLQYNIKSMNPKTYKMLNNFLMLKEKEKDECLWYSEAIRKRDFDK